MNTRYHYYDWQAHEFYDPHQDGRRVWGFSMPKLETVLHRVAVTNGKATIDSDGKPAAAYRHSLADKASVVFALKTFENAALEDGGDVSVATAGFATDASWHLLSGGMFSVESAVPLAVSGGIYYPEFVLIDSGNDEESLDSGEYDQTCEVRRRVYTGAEASAPEGNTAANWYDGTILTGSDNVVIPITGMTTSGRVLPVQTGGGALPGLAVVKAANQVTVSTTGPVGEDIPVSVKVEALS